MSPKDPPTPPQAGGEGRRTPIDPVEARPVPLHPPSPGEWPDEEPLFAEDGPPEKLVAAKEELSRKLLADAPSEKAFRSWQFTPVAPHPRANVVGVGVGAKLVAGRPTRDPAVTIFVRRKFPPAELEEGYRLPREFGGFPTHVVETGVFSLHGGNPAGIPFVNPRRACRPVQPGCGIGTHPAPNPPHWGSAGTLGLLVKLRSGAALYLLSAGHLLTDGGQRKQRGAPVFHPSWADVSQPAPDQIAALEQWVLWAEHKRVTVDAAVAAVAGGLPVSGSVLAIGALAGHAAPRARAQVEKFGRSTAHKTGRIAATNTDVSVDVGQGQSRIYRNQFVIHGDNLDLFSAAGDSGAAVVASSGRKVVGLLVGGVDGGRTGSYSLATPIKVILDALGVDLVC